MCYNHLKIMLYNLKRVLLLFVLFIFNFSFFVVEKPGLDIIINNTSFNFLNNINKHNLFFLKASIGDNINNKRSLYAYTGFNS